MKESIVPFYHLSEDVVEKSLGCYLFDSNGKEYLDLESGVWCTNLGHSHERIVTVIRRQLEKSIHNGYRFRSLESEKLSEELQNLIGFRNGASVFLSSGSEAVNLSIKIVQKLTGKKKVLKISDTYLSAFGFGEIHPENEYVVSAQLNDSENLENIDFSAIAALVLEVGGASVNMIHFPTENFIRKLTKLCSENNCLVVANEVTTGMGRMGKWFGFQHYNYLPDIVVTGKALGNGYPISAVTVSSSVLERLNQTKIFRYAQSHQNDPLGCAIGLEVIKVIKEENLIENCKNIGAFFKEKLEILQSSYSCKIKEIRARGLMLALEFQNSFNGTQLNEKLFESGFVFSFKQNTMRFLPPLIITEGELDKLISKLTYLLQRE